MPYLGGEGEQLGLDHRELLGPQEHWPHALMHQIQGAGGLLAQPRHDWQ